MSRIFFFVVLLGLLVLGVAIVILGGFPPTPAVHPVEKVLPNDKFQGH